MYPKVLETGRKTYYIETGRIFSIEDDGFGFTITHTYLTSDDQNVLERVWFQFHDIYTYGRESKQKEFKRAIGL